MAVLWVTGCVVVINSDYNRIKSDPDTETHITQDNDETKSR